MRVSAGGMPTQARHLRIQRLPVTRKTIHFVSLVMWRPWVLS